MCKINIIGKLWDVKYAHMEKDNGRADWKTMTITVDSRLSEFQKQDILIHEVGEIILTDLKCRTNEVGGNQTIVYQLMHSDFAGQDMFSVFLIVLMDTIKRNKCLLKILEVKK
jgi:hypothetical protein